MHTIYTKAVLHAAKADDSGRKTYTFRATTAAVDRTRDSHLEVHGEEVPLDDNFSLGGPAPGQIGDAGEDINCRCTMTFVVDDGKMFRTGILDGLRAFVANGVGHG